MWQKFIDALRLIFNFSEELRRNREAIERLEKENHQFSTALQIIVREMEHLKRMEQSEREKLELRLKIALLEANKQLPPSENEK